MPRKKTPCRCGNSKSAEALLCRQCRDANPYPRTPEHKDRMAAAMTGKRHDYRSASTRPEVADKIRSWWTPERRERQRRIAKANAGDPRLSLAGEKNPNWQDGRCETPYAPGWTLALRRTIRERDKVCQDCGRDGRLHVHHVDFEKHDHSPENLVALCHPCHFARHAEHRRSA